MKTSTGSVAGTLTVVLCNLAGMVDLVALPLWVGSLMQSRGLRAQQAGLLVSAYILGVFVSSLVFAPRLNAISGRLAAVCGFFVASAAFFALAAISDFPAMIPLHIVAGLGAGCGLSITHGTIGRSANPHRLFAMAGAGTGLFAILFFAAMPAALAAHGATALFTVLGTLLALAALAAAISFPLLDPFDPLVARRKTARFGIRALSFVAVACLATTQAMIFSFVERAGVAHGFSTEMIATMLIIGGFTNLTAPLCAALLDKKVSHLGLAVAILPLHAFCGAMAMLSTSYLSYAAFAIAFVWLIIFGHNFMFSVIAKLDPSGRMVATTPAMLMIGSAIGPILGGTLVETSGYPSLAVAAGVIAAFGTICFTIIWHDRRNVAREATPANELLGAAR